MLACAAERSSLRWTDSRHRRRTQSGTTLDDTDRKMIRALQGDGRMSNADLARMVDQLLEEEVRSLALDDMAWSSFNYPEGSAESVGRQTTRAVVVAITLVILIDAVAAVVLRNVGFE